MTVLRVLRLGCVLIVLAAAPATCVAADPAVQAAIAKLTLQQQATLKAYKTARLDFERQTEQYWRDIDLKRKRRSAKSAHGTAVLASDYVQTQPPAYKGPKRPDEIYALLPKPPQPPKPSAEPPKEVPVVTDFLYQAEAVYGFKPDRVPEDEFMLSYAMEALKLGLSKDQVIRVYALETGGIGTCDLQSGYNPRTGHAASTALGYAQLLAANSIEQVQTQGTEFAARLDRAVASGDGRGDALTAKAAVLRRMTADAKAIPNKWAHQVAYAKTPKGLAMHTLNLDGDIGPWMQVIKLRSVMDFASKKGMTTLTGGQLEMMNLAGPGRGFEMMQPIGRDAPTANFFDRKAYARNPVVNGKTGVQLLATLDQIMDRNVLKQGSVRFAQIFETAAKRVASGGDAAARPKSSFEEMADALNPFGSR